MQPKHFLNQPVTSNLQVNFIPQQLPGFFTSFQDLLQRSKYDKIIVVTLLNSIEDHWLRRRSKSEELVLFDHKPLFFHFKRPDQTEIQEILKQRMESLESTQFLPQNIIRYASILSFGLPGLALWLIRNIPLKIIDRNQVQKLTLLLITRLPLLLPQLLLSISDKANNIRI